MIVVLNLSADRFEDLVSVLECLGPVTVEPGENTVITIADVEEQP